MKEYDFYLFDADGTLIDTRELIFQSFSYMTDVMGLPRPDRIVVDSLIGLPMLPQLERFIGPGKGDATYVKGHEIYQEFHVREHRRYLGIFPGIKKGLSTLRAMGKKLAVVSSRGTSTLIPFLEAMEIREFFPILVSADDTKKHKPHPEPALHCLQLMQGNAGKSVFIGDAQFDMSCGNAAGMDTAYVEWGGMDYSQWPVKPDFVAKVFADLLPDNRER